MRSGQRALVCIALALCAGTLFVSASRAASAPVGSQALLPALLAAALVGMGLAMIWVRRASRRRGNRAVERMRRLELRLAEAEALLGAEPQLLIVWKGKAEQPYRQIGDIRGVAGVPKEPARQHRYEGWMAEDSLADLQRHLADLRASGTSFNIHVATREGGLLEADGRAAGGMATLRIRPVEGKREERAELERALAEARGELRSYKGFLDNAPLPVWLSRDDGPAWANRAYLAALGREEAGQGEPGAALREAGGSEGRSLEILEVDAGTARGGLAIDVTALDKARADLDLHISAHTRALDRLATAVAIFGPDRRLDFFNPSYAQLWQLDQTWLRQRPSDGDILDALREARMLPEQADYREWKRQRLAAYEGDGPREDWWHLPDGRSIRVLTEKHPSGGLTYLYEDATEKFDLESRHNALIHVQKETLDNLHEGVALFGSDGRLKLHNPAFAALWKLEPALLEGEPHISEVIPACTALFDEEAAWDEVKWAVTSLDDERRPLGARLSRRDGSVVSFASVPLPDGATLLTYMDITDSTRIERALRERNEALEAADRLKTEFVSHVSYQLRLPLTNIIGFAESLAMGIAGELTPKQSEYVRDVLQSSQQLLTLINDILDLATIDAGAMELKLGAVDVKEAMLAVAGLIKPKLREKALRLQIAVPRNIGTFVADERRVKQVLFNLLANAASFSPRGGEIKLACRRDGGDLCLSVSDRGPGIAPEDQSAVFERFETRGGRSHHRGAGLGLAIVKSFVELHGGSVVLRSEPGRGTTVECRFPLNAGAAAEGGEAAAPQPAAAGTA